MKDIFGKALLDYYNNNYTEDIVTWTNISDKDHLPITYLFRNYVEMPKLEQKALQLAKGKILDVGCGSGSHSLYLQDKGFKVKAIDISKGAIDVVKKRGVITTEHKALLDETETFDTILLLMNGTGIFEEIIQVSDYLKHLKSLLNPNGQILIDSSDISYMYQDDDGTSTTHFDKLSVTLSDHYKVVDEELTELNNVGRYYGELDYYLSYKGNQELPLKWLYLDFETLKTACLSIGLNCEKVMDGDHYDYLAKLIIQ